MAREDKKTKAAEHSHKDCNHDHNHDHAHEGCGHDPNHLEDETPNQEELFLDEAFVQATKEKYPKEVWIFLEQAELFPEMETMFADLTDFDLLRLHIDALTQMALDDTLLERDPTREMVARGPYLALHALSAMGLPDPDLYEKITTLMEQTEIHGLVDQALFTLFRSNPEPSYKALFSFYDNLDSSALGRYRALGNMLSIPANDAITREERAKRIADFLYRPQSSDPAKNREQNASLIDLVMVVYEKTQDPQLTDLYSVMQEAFEEGRVSTEEVTLEEMEAVFGDYDVSVEILTEREPNSTTYLTCEECHRIYPYTAEVIYYDPIVLHAHLSPEEVEEAEQAALDIHPIWFPETVQCPRCDAQDTYNLSFRGYKVLLAEFTRLMAKAELEEAYPSPYKTMNFTFLGRITHPLEAMELAYHALEQYPNAAGIRIELSRFLARQGDYEEARTQLLQAVKDDPTEPGGYKGMAWLAEETGSQDEATQWWLQMQNSLNEFEISQSSRRELQQDIEDNLARLQGSQFAVQHTQRQTGRNDPCPCGSGKKFKRCCLK